MPNTEVLVRILHILIAQANEELAENKRKEEEEF